MEPKCTEAKVYGDLAYMPQGGGGDLEDFYPDVCVEGFEKDPF